MFFYSNITHTPLGTLTVVPPSLINYKDAWRSKACASAHSRTVPVNPLQPLRCCHRAAAVALCAAAALRADADAADAATTAAPLPSCC